MNEGYPASLSCYKTATSEGFRRMVIMQSGKPITESGTRSPIPATRPKAISLGSESMITIPRNR